MYPYGCVELRFSRTAIERDREALDDLSRVWADHMTSQYFIRRLIDDDFHHDLLFATGHRVLKRPKACLVNIDGFVLLARQRFSQANCANIGRAEDGGGNIQIVWLYRIVVEQGFGNRASFGDGHRRQHHAIRAIADRIDAIDISFGKIIDGDGAIQFHFYSSLLEPERPSVWQPA